MKIHIFEKKNLLKTKMNKMYGGFNNNFSFY